MRFVLAQHASGYSGRGFLVFIKCDRDQKKSRNKGCAYWVELQQSVYEVIISRVLQLSLCLVTGEGKVLGWCLDVQHP